MDAKQTDANYGKFHTTHAAGRLIVTEVGYPTYVFRIVDSVPRPYTVWNIGTHMPEGWLPLCRLMPDQPFPDGCSVDPDSLMAVKTGGADVILKAAAYGLNTLEKTERFVQDNWDTEEGSGLYEYIERAKKALPYMRQIKWD